ncbi:MAG: polynucleotide kinase-phosphatase [Eubacteriaceae bacterium]|nr:polynucleotide kinase-phosphatase [Eubacteriaceae bacterium]
MQIEIPEIAVVALVGVSGSGKSTFAKQFFKPTQVLSSDFFRALVSDDENNQNVSAQAFDALYYIANKRLDMGLLTVIDATNVQKEARKQVLNLAKEQNCHPVAIVLDMPEKLCQERTKHLPGRAQIISRQSRQLRRSINSLRKEGFRHVYILKSEEEIHDAKISIIPMPSNKKSETGPFDIIGDIHGCYDELCELLGKLGYSVDAGNFSAIPPIGRKAVFLGDLCDRGPQNAEALRLVMGMASAGDAYCLAGNHDAKLQRYLGGSKVQMANGIEITAEQLGSQPEEFIGAAKEFLGSLGVHYVLDGGKLVVAHAGLTENYHNRRGGRVRSFCLYGDTTGESDEFGLPVRLTWANDYRGKALVVYGHTPAPEIGESNNTVCIDTGCVFGGKLSALRYPEREIVQVKAKMEYFAPAKPLDSRNVDDSMLCIEDILGLKYLSTRLRRSIKINEEHSAAALEVMSRFAAAPQWLIFLPPTMSPCETSNLDGYLEHPDEAFGYYRSQGIGSVVCEEKHMGSRAVIVLCKNPKVAARRFKVDDGAFGIVYTRTGRFFFDDIQTQNSILERLQNQLEASHFWDDFSTDWVCLDTELMPWSAKAQQLLEDQYAPVGRAGRNSLSQAVGAIGNAILAIGSGAQEGSVDLPALLERQKTRAKSLDLYTEAYRRYCWDVNGIGDYRIAPFHILATEGKTWTSESHVWHMDSIARYIAGNDPIFIATRYIVVDLNDNDSVSGGVGWWEELSGSGGEGMVVKPLDFISMKGPQLLQPAIKCRGREYLRIIYGPEYLLEENLARLKKRSLSKKRNLALNEFALGVESLERFVGKEPLYRVHECVFGVLAMESEPVDPRL